MAQADGVVANGTGAAVRSDLNGQLAALFTNHSGSTSPSTTYAHQFWADTNENVLKIRNAANNAWITLRELDGTMLIEDGSASTPGLAFADDTNTGIFSPAADQIGFATGGAERLEIGSSEVVFNDPSNDVDFRVESNGNTHMLFVDAGSDRIGIGASSPVRQVHISHATTAELHFTNDTIGNTSSDGSTIYVANTGELGIRNRENSFTTFYTNNTERARIDSSGRLLMGTSTSPSAGGWSQYARLVVKGNTTGATNSAGVLNLGSGAAATAMGTNDGAGVISFSDISGNEFATIVGSTDGTTGSGDYPGKLVFSTTADGASSSTERMRLAANGYLKVSNNGTYISGSSYHEFNQSASDRPNLYITASNTSYASDILFLRCNRSSSSGFYFMVCRNSGTSNNAILLRGDGNAFADGSWSGGGADYAEYFEWSDGNTEAEDRRGISVVLDGDKIREAVAGEEPIGVISGNPSVVGDGDVNQWKHKHLRDDYGSYVLDENGDRQVNPDYNPDTAYVSREDRAEWATVGLMGKLRIRKGQVTGTRWIKMRDVSDIVEEWLVR